MRYGISPATSCPSSSEMSKIPAYLSRILAIVLEEYLLRYVSDTKDIAENPYAMSRLYHIRQLVERAR